MSHEDGSAYYPLVATVSLGAPIVLDLYEKNGQCSGKSENYIHTNVPSRGKPHFRILQERRSLLVLRKRTYTDLLHGIAETVRDEDLGPHSICNWDLLRDKASYSAGWYTRETRTSLTYRDVLKVAKIGDTLKFLGGSS